MHFRNIWLPQVHAADPEPAEKAEPEPDLVDPQTELREYCANKREINRFYNTLQECNDRVSSREKTQETCMQELFDYVHALDHCVAKTLFSKLT